MTLLIFLSTANCRAGMYVCMHVCMYVCMYVCKNVLLLGPTCKLCIRTPRTLCNTCSIKHFTHFAAVLILRDTDKMPLKSSCRDSRWQGDRERRWSPTSKRHKYVAPNVWWVNPSGKLKKLRNTGSKPTFDSIYRYQHSHHLSTERLDCHNIRQQTSMHRLPEVTL